MHHFMVMRFSCFVSPKSGDIGKNGFSTMWYTYVKDKNNPNKYSLEEYTEKYKNYLYSEDRMNTKFEAFSRIFLPSLEKSISIKENWTLLIFITKKHMPKKYYEKLVSLVDDIDKVKIVELSDPYNDDEYQTYTEDLCSHFENWSITWIGDDDAINPDHFTIIENESKNHSVPFIYTMPKLKTVSFDKSFGLVYGEDFIHNSTHGLALTGVNVNPTRLGAHYAIHNNYPDLKIVKNFDVYGGVLFCDINHTASCRDSDTKHYQIYKGDS